MSDIDAFVRDEANALVEELSRWCAIPSISGDPRYADELARSAEHAVELMRAAGLHAEVLQTAGGEPAAFGEWAQAGPDAPTVTIYGHHDVQPADPVSDWTTTPFEPSVRDGYLYARGVADDKGLVHQQLAAVRHLLAADGRLPVNVRFLIEGEEELLSPHLETLLAENRERLACDLVLVADTGMLDADTPTITISVRGSLSVALELRTGAGDLHAGAYGGAVPNAGRALVELIGAMRSPDGTIAIDGFYDDVREPAQEHRRLIAEAPFDAEAYRSMLGVFALMGESGYSPLERIGLRPAFEVNAIHTGYDGPGMRASIPCKARATLSFKLVPDQSPDLVLDRLERWTRDHAPEGSVVELRPLARSWPSFTPVEHPGNVALHGAVERVWGSAPFYVFEGAAGPQRTLIEGLGAECVHFGTCLSDDNYHAPNERLLLSNYLRGVRAAADFLLALGEIDRSKLLVNRGA
ncbi:MAG: M20/M25/M40 family metallo-hydrolase [Solirubrobacteraceae bacterium]